MNLGRDTKLWGFVGIGLPVGSRRERCDSSGPSEFVDFNQSEALLFLVLHLLIKLLWPMRARRVSYFTCILSP